MQADRKIQINDLNICEISDRNGMYGGMAGLKEGIMWNNAFWLVKYPKAIKGMTVSYTTSPLSEYIGSHIYEILGYDVHETILGERHGKIVVACKDFCESVGDLREFRTLKNIYNDALEEKLIEELKETSSSHMVDLMELCIHFDNNPVLSKITGLKERFWDCAIIDGMIKNNDRNNGNWGLLYVNKNYKLAPIYDNGASFSNKLSDDNILRILSDESKMKNNALNSVTAYAYDEKHLNFKALLTLNIPELKEAIRRVTPLLKAKAEEIYEMIYAIPATYHSFMICSEERKEFYVKSMDIRMKALLEPAYETILLEVSDES